MHVSASTNCYFLQEVRRQRTTLWPERLLLSLEDAFFAAHALGCLTVLDERQQPIPLEVSVLAGMSIRSFCRARTRLYECAAPIAAAESLEQACLICFGKI